MRKNIKIQTKCVQTVLDSEGKFLNYKLVYPISNEFKNYLAQEELDEHDCIVSFPIKNKAHAYRHFYIKISDNFKKIKTFQFLISIKAINFKLKLLNEKKNVYINMYTNVEENY
jgi:hypothetical protein